MPITITPEITSILYTGLVIIFYIIMLGFTTYSFLTLYALLRYGKSKMVGLVVLLFYVVITSSLFSTALDNLNKIKLP